MLDVYTFAMLTALLWGFTPIIEKRGLVAGGSPLQGTIVVVLIDSLLYWILIFLVFGTRPFAGVSATIIGAFIFAGFIGTAIGRLALFVGIDYIGASISNAVMSTRPLFATIVAVSFIDEVVNFQHGMGIIVIVGGLTLLATSKGGDVTGWQSWHVLFPLIGAGMFGISNVIRRWGLDTSPITPLEAVALNETTALIILLAYGLATGGRSVLDMPRTSWVYFGGSGIITAVAFLSLYEALARGPVSIVDPLYATAPLFTTIFAYFFLRDIERITMGIVLGVIAIVIGVGLITTA